MITRDEQYMRMALDLAKRGGRAVAPNPMVGAVIVKKGRVIGQGYHCFFGGPHAEAEAIRSVKNPRDLVGATLYVTLQPCHRFGKTPPCTRAIEKVGISRVVAGSRDPSIKKLRITTARAGQANYELRILKGDVADECERLNKFFFKWTRTGLPYVTVKVAVSPDGFVAGPEGRRIKITDAKQDRAVHQLRAQHQAILVSASTVLRDDPHLGVRHIAGEDPLRVILDSHLRTPLDAMVFRDSNALLACLGTHRIKRIKAYADLGISVWCSPGQDYVDLKTLFRYLGERGIGSVLVEPGPTLFRVLQKDRLIDETIVFTGTKAVGQGLRLQT